MRKQHFRRRQRLLNRSAARIDALESRRLLAAIINGSNGDDTFIVSVGSGNAISLTFNGVPQSVGIPADGIVEVHGLNGNDDITLLNTGTLEFWLFGEFGDDDYIVGNGNLINDVKRNVMCAEASGTGNDTCTINDLNGPGLSWRSDGSSFSFLSLSSPFIEMPAMGDPGDSALIRASNNDDTLTILNSGTIGGFPAKTLFDLGGGSDTVHLGGSQSSVVPNLPASSTIFAGETGIDVVTIDDSNPSSTRTSIDFDENGLVGGPRLLNFNSMTVMPHALADNLPEPITFRGFNSPVPAITITGRSGPDLIQFGTPDHPITSQNYWGSVNLNLGTSDKVEINQSLTQAASAWTFQNAGLAVATGPASFFCDDFIDLTIRSTNQNDVFTVIDTPDPWAIFIEANGGDDLVQMSTVRDLDDVFDSSTFYFLGGSGTNTINVNDVDDAIGDNDEYQIGSSIGMAGNPQISDGSIQKKDFLAAHYSTVLAYHRVDHLVLGLDNDSNNVDFDFGGLHTVEIFGNNGNDIFTNNNFGSSRPNSLASTLTDSIALHGGAGTDEIVLNDSDASLLGPTPDYTLDIAAFQWIVDTTARTIAFDSFDNFVLTTGEPADFVRINHRPAVTSLNVASGIGNDTFSIGGGDLDSNGLLAGGATLSAGTGNDEIIFDDHLDTQADGETSNYTFSSFALAKGTPSISFSTFEAVTLLAANGVVANQINTIPVVSMNSLNGFVNSATITGGLARGCVVNVGNGTLGSLPLTNTFSSCTTVNINDGSFTGPSNWNTTSTAITRTTSNQVFNYQACAIVINTGSGDDTVGVNGLGAGSSLNVNAGNGIDRFTLGSGNIDSDILGPVALIGGAGNNGLTINNSNDAAAESQSLSNTAFVDGFTHTFSGLTSLIYNGGSGGTNLSVSSGLIPTTINGGNGNDTFDLFNGSMISNFATNMTLNAGGGDDAMNLLGQNDSSAGRYDFTNQNQFRFGDVNTPKILTFNGLERATLQSSSAGDNINVTLTAVALKILSGAGNDVVTISNLATQVSPFPITVNTGPEVASFGGGDDLTIGLAVVVFDQSDSVRNLNIGGTLRITSGAVLARVPPLFDLFGLQLSGTIDIANGAFLYRAGGQAADFRTLLTRGRNGGTWNGTNTNGAINSSTAAASSTSDGVGYGLGSEITPTAIGGFAINPGDTLLRYALDGDANLDQTVNFDDLLRLAQNYNIAAGSTWTKGDSNYDNAVDFTDLLSLAQRFGASALVMPAAQRARSAPIDLLE